MSGQRVEGEIEPIAGEEGHAAQCQAPSQGVDHCMCHVLRTKTELKHGQNLGARIDNQPQPEHLGGAAEPGANFVQLQVREVQVAEAALMEEPSVLSRASKPGDDGGVTGAEDTLCGGWVQPFGQRREHHGDLLGRSFQAIQGGVAPGSERGMAGRASERLDLLSTTVLAIPDERVDLLDFLLICTYNKNINKKEIYPDS
jgi:hypothetical protein